MSQRVKFTPVEDRDLLDFVDKHKSTYPPGVQKVLAIRRVTTDHNAQLAGHEVSLGTTDPGTTDEEDDDEDQDRILSTTPHSTTTALRTDDEQTDKD